MSNGGKSTTAPAFLEKLYDILDDPSLEPYIGWQEGGNSFLIKNVNYVSETILPKYFKHNNIQSFIRQLNMYSFTKTRHDSNYREFIHPLFLRGRRDLLPTIKRKTQSTNDRGSQSSSRSNRDVENEHDRESADYRDGSLRQSDEESRTADDDEDLVDVDSVPSLKLNMKRLQSQLWAMSERYSDLSANYDDLKDRMDRLEACHQRGRCTCHLFMPIAEHKSPHIATVKSEPSLKHDQKDSGSIVRTISIEPHYSSGAIKRGYSMCDPGEIQGGRLPPRKRSQHDYDSPSEGSPNSRNQQPASPEYRNGFGLEAIIAAADLSAKRDLRSNVTEVSESSPTTAAPAVGIAERPVEKPASGGGDVKAAVNNPLDQLLDAANFYGHSNTI